MVIRENNSSNSPTGIPLAAVGGIRTCMNPTFSKRYKLITRSNRLLRKSPNVIIDFYNHLITTAQSCFCTESLIPALNQVYRWFLLLVHHGFLNLHLMPMLTGHLTAYCGRLRPTIS